MSDYVDVDRARDDLVASLTRAGHAEGRVADALRRVPRHLFLPQEARVHAYEDAPLAIGEGQTISAPHMVAIMASHLDAQPGHRVLEVGGGSGYHAAVLAELVTPDGHVWSLEHRPRLAERARAHLTEAGYEDRVTIEVADGSLGLADAAPFDRISVAAAAPRVPPPLLDQLAEGGRLLVPVGPREAQVLLQVDRGPEGLREADLGGCRFVPLEGAHGFTAPT